MLQASIFGQDHRGQFMVRWLLEPQTQRVQTTSGGPDENVFAGC